jgi:hypothetical protein
MTTGTEGSPSIDSPPEGIYRYRQWSGDDGKYESYNGSVRPKWNSLQSSRRLASVNGDFVFVCPHGHLSTAKLQTLQAWGTCGFPTTSDSDNLERLSKLLAKIKGHSFNAAVSVSQAHQLASMVVGNLSKFGQSIMALKHGDFKTAARCLGAAPRPSKLKANDIGGRWLELQYGWLPSISDTYEAARAYEAISNGPAKARFSAATKKKTSKLFSSASYIADRMIAEGIYSRTYTFEMYEELGFARQLGLTDPASVLWENIPYSFVVDWFIPIGTYLSNLAQIPHLSGRWLVTDYAQWRINDMFWEGSFLPTCNIHTLTQCTSLVSMPNVHYLEEHVSRSAATPSVNFPNVTVLGAVHGRRIFNAIALATGRFAGIKSSRGYYNPAAGYSE